MNEANYCSLSAAQRLREAGIKIDADFYHVRHGSGGYWQQSILSKNDLITMRRESIIEVLPAPTMAEVWRELPETQKKGQFYYHKCIYSANSMTVAAYSWNNLLDLKSCLNENPTDALIDLLIQRR